MLVEAKISNIERFLQTFEISPKLKAEDSEKEFI